jgi:hypothetical protein
MIVIFLQKKKINYTNLKNASTTSLLYGDLKIFGGNTTFYMEKKPYECYICNTRPSITRHTEKNHINAICVIAHVVLNLVLQHI